MDNVTFGARNHHVPVIFGGNSDKGGFADDIWRRCEIRDVVAVDNSEWSTATAIHERKRGTGCVSERCQRFPA